MFTSYYIIHPLANAYNCFYRQPLKRQNMKTLVNRQNMKTLVLILLTICFLKVNGQNYTIGVPVYDTVVSGNSAYLNSTFYPCPQNRIGFDQSLINQINGVSYYFKIKTSTLPANSIKEFTSNTVMNVGDSIELTTLINNLDFAAMTSGGSFNWCLLASGTPTMANDSFFCNSQISSYAYVETDGCANKVVFNYYPSSTTPLCTISGATYNNEIYSLESNVIIAPNPSNGEFLIWNIDPYTNFVISDILGNIIYNSSLNSHDNKISLNGISEGIYFLNIFLDHLTITKKIIIKKGSL